MRSIHTLSIITAALGATLLPTLALAEEPVSAFQLHLEPAAAVPLTAPQSDIYQPGVALEAKGLFSVTRNVAVGPAVQALYLPRETDNGLNAGVLWLVGPSVRVQGERTGRNATPWIDLDAMLAHTGDLWRPAFDVGLGIEAPLDNAGYAWAGPFVRYQQTVETSTVQSGVRLDPRNPAMLEMGLSFSFDFPVKTYHRTVRSTVVKYVPSEPRVVVKQTPPVIEQVSIIQKVYFDWDSPKLRWESKDKLDVIVAELNKHPNLHIRVQGNASADGNRHHNEVLAAKRARSVFDYLVDKGVPASRLTVESFGIDKPVAPNTSQEGRERNRRAEFQLTFTSSPR
jgi:outer membrane protein OmpA-like peptidoglycan-associated protein